MSKVTATWIIELNCECPKCKEWVNLLDYPDFWEGQSMKTGESRTKNSIDTEVVCPECNHEFKVDCEY